MTSFPAQYVTYRIAETSGSLLGKDGTGGDGPTEKLGDVGEGGATVRGGIEGGGRIGRKKSGGSHDGGRENEAGHGDYCCTDIGQSVMQNADLVLHENRNAGVSAPSADCLLDLLTLKTSDL